MVYVDIVHIDGLCKATDLLNILYTFLLLSFVCSTLVINVVTKTTEILLLFFNLFEFVLINYLKLNTLKHSQNPLLYKDDTDLLFNNIVHWTGEALFFIALFP